jgi:hypothetical protein
MTLLHELGVQLGDKRKDLRHVLDALVEASETLVPLNFFVGLRVSLLSSHVSSGLD